MTTPTSPQTHTKAPPSLEIGAPAPDFLLPCAGPCGAHSKALSSPLRLSSLRPLQTVLFFYPRAQTPGCTQEAQEFSALAGAFVATQTAVIGLSKDPLPAQERFCQKHALDLTLASDAAADTCERYGVWGEKRLYGKVFMGITRTTFLIGADGRIKALWPKVKVAGHAQIVLEAAQSASPA